MTVHEVHGLKYIDHLPSKYVIKATFITGVELLRLKGGKKKWTIGNIELREGLPLFIKSHDKYWCRRLHLDHDLSRYRKYIKDGNLYLYFDDNYREIAGKEKESEGMGYYLYNKLRELLLIQEALLSKNGEDDAIKIKQRAIQIEIDKLKNNTT